MRPPAHSGLRPGGLKIFNSVLLPAPFRPMMPTTSPCLTSKETSLSAQKSSADLRFQISDFRFEDASNTSPCPSPRSGWRGEVWGARPSLLAVVSEPEARLPSAGVPPGGFIVSFGETPKDAGETPALPFNFRFPISDFRF